MRWNASVRCNIARNSLHVRRDIARNYRNCCGCRPVGAHATHLNRFLRRIVDGLAFDTPACNIPPQSCRCPPATHSLRTPNPDNNFKSPNGIPFSQLFSASGTKGGPAGLSSLLPSNPYMPPFSRTACASSLLHACPAGVHLHDMPFGPPCLGNTNWENKFQGPHGIATSQLLSSSGTKVALPGLPHHHFLQSPLIFHQSHVP